MIAIIDYGAGNLSSVEKAIKYLGYEVCISDDTAVLDSADKLILPGVGSFGSAMEKLKSKGLDVYLKNTKKQVLGICLGLQLLFEYSEESNCEGLGILKGTVKRIPDTGLKIPQIGWNSLDIKGGKLFSGIEKNSYVYFVHSYYVVPDDKAIVTASVEYGATLDIAVECENFHAVQFHPEKSGDTGLAILKNFID